MCFVLSNSLSLVYLLTQTHTHRYVPAFVNILREDPSLEKFHNEKKRLKLKRIDVIDRHQRYLNLNEIWHYRELARVQIDHEEEVKAIKEQAEKERKRLEKESKKGSGGWFGGWFGSKTKEDEEKEMNRKASLEEQKKRKMREAHEKIAKMEEDFKEAESLLEYDPDEVPFWKQMKALDKMATVRILTSHLFLIHTHTHTQIRFRQHSISVGLLNEDGKTTLTTMTVRDLFADVTARVSYVELSMHVQNLDVSDEFVKDTKYPSIVSYSNKKPLLELSATAPPPDDKNLVARVRCEMRPVDVIISLPLVQRLTYFFDTQPVNLNALRDMLLEKVANLRKSAETNVQSTMKDRKTMGLDVAMKWRVGRVILPCDSTHKTTKKSLVVNLGELEVRSASKTEDRFDVNLSNLEILLSETPLLERFSVQNQVLVNLQPRLGVDASTKISTKISDVRVVITKSMFS